MNPGSSETSGLNLPPPVGEAVSPVGADTPSGAEKRPANPERYSQSGQTAAAGQPLVPLPLPTAGPGPAPSSATTKASRTSAAPLADDSDLIEKEWVEKAKAIVERTRDNPHQQSQELTVVKADYMKQRYDKTIKVNN